MRALFMGDSITDMVAYDHLRALLLLIEFGGTFSDWLNQPPESFELAWEYRNLLEGRRNPRA